MPILLKTDRGRFKTDAYVFEKTPASVFLGDQVVCLGLIMFFITTEWPSLSNNLFHWVKKTGLF